jgi:translation initiation factor 2 subunit 1
MFYKKKGLPEEGDVLLCTVKKILYHSVFVDLDEYERQEGMVHISEIAPGRIRNIRDYVREGKKLVCKVLRINNERRQVDLSLRRVPLSVRKEKNESYKQEQKAEKILEFVAKILKTDIKGMYEKAGYKIMEEYGSLSDCFYEVAEKGDGVLKELGIADDYVKVLAEVIKERIKPPEVQIDGILTLTSAGADGVEDIKKAIKVGLDLAKKKKYDITVLYMGAPRYRVAVTAPNYKVAERALKEVSEVILDTAKSLHSKGEFSRK